MSEAALQQLSDAQAALIAALGTHDLDAIEAANIAMVAAVNDVRAAGGWLDRPHLRADVVQILQTADAARGRVNLLADSNRRNLDKLISLVAPQRTTPYGRNGLLG